MVLNKKKEKTQEDIQVHENDERNSARSPKIDKFQQMLDESQTIEFLTIKDGKKRKTKDSKAFATKYAHIIDLDQKQSTEGCVLHRIAKARIDDVGEKYASLIEWCVTKKMLQVANITSNYTPLHTALSEGNHSFVGKIIQIAKGRNSRKLGADIISARAHSGHNYFHLAIENSSKYTIELINLYQEYLSESHSTDAKALRQRVQGDHHTPLHLIMDPKQTHVQQYDPDMRLNVMKALIEADPGSLECRTMTQKLTPYQYRLYILEKKIRETITAQGQNSSLKSRKT